MEYQLFLQEIRKHILEHSEWNISEENYKLYQDGYIAANEEELIFIRNANVRYNHVEADTLIGDFIKLELSAPDSGSMLCRFSVKYLYEEYKTGGWEKIDFIINENMKLAANSNMEEISSHIMDYSYIRERLILRPINFTDNQCELKDYIYEQIGDIALVLYVFLYDNAELGLGTIKVPKNVFDEWGKEREEVWQEALVNTNVSAPPRMYTNMNDIMNPSYTKGVFMGLNTKIEKLGQNPLFPPVITTTKKKNGAIAMFYPGVQEKLSEICGGSYYISFASIDEVYLHPKNTTIISPRDILQSLNDVNNCFNKPEDILSRKLFFYDHKKKVLEVMKL